MTTMTLLLTAVALYLLVSLFNLALFNNARLATFVSAWGGTLAGLFGIASGWHALIGTTSTLIWHTPFPYGQFMLRLDPFAGLLVLVITLLGTLGSIYSLAYVRHEYKGHNAAAMGVFFNLFIAAMLLVVTSENALWFLVFFEIMTLTSWFLVVIEQDKESISAGLLYFLIAHAGSVAIMAAFFLLAYNAGGDFNFPAFRAHAPGPVLASVAFLLAFIGFGAKAGMVPLHAWLPRAHPAAPSHASSLMSGAMVKIGIFGIVKVGADLLGTPLLWWGVIVVTIGGISAVFGIIYALNERDIKRLLAYSTVENVGIILLGMGIGMVGLANHAPLVAALGFLAGSLHLLNHATFKGLLFLGAGSLLYRMGTKDIRLMGGLHHSMPWTSLCFLIGALAISATPPLNGFVSEWFTYQALVSGTTSGGSLILILAPLAAAALALTGALAVMCFVKAYGEIFSGAPRSPMAEQGEEVPASMRIASLLLTLVCVALGIASPWLVPVITPVAITLASSTDYSFSTHALLTAGHVNALVSPLVMALLLVGFLVIPIILRRLFKSSRIASRKAAQPWAAGYLPDTHMAVSAESFVAPMRRFYQPLYHMRRFANLMSAKIAAGFTEVVNGSRYAEPLLERFTVTPIVSVSAWVGGYIQRIQNGALWLYCLYIVVALACLLAAVVIWGR